MPSTVQTTDLRRHVREILERVRTRRETFIIQSYKTPQAVILPYEEYLNFTTWQSAHEKRTAWLGELRQIAEQVSQYSNLSEDEAQKMIDEASKS